MCRIGVIGSKIDQDEKSTFYIYFRNMFLRIHVLQTNVINNAVAKCIALVYSGLLKFKKTIVVFNKIAFPKYFQGKENRKHNTFFNFKACNALDISKL